jgi:cobalt-zinc-cadmium efflux system protein
MVASFEHRQANPEARRVVEEHSHDFAADVTPALGSAAGLNATYVVELAFGFSFGSLALLANAAHNLTDAASLLLARGAAMLAQRRPTQRHTYGLGQAAALDVLANAVIILIRIAAIGWETVHRFRETVEVAAGTVLWVAALGIAIKHRHSVFLRARHNDLNAREAFLHKASGAAIPAGPLTAGRVIPSWPGPMDRAADAR